MPEPDAERAVVAAFFDSQQLKDLDRVLACWSTDGVMRTPYAPPPLPRIATGHSQLARTFSALFAGSEAITLGGLRVLATEESGFWVAQWSFDIRLHTGRNFSGSDIGTFRMRDGLIAEYTEYFDPVACAQAYGLSLPK